MTPAESSTRRLLAGGTLFVALGALGVASAPPAAAGPLVWGSAQAWLADGDLVTGYSTAISFGGERRDEAAAEPLLGPLAAYAQVRGESRAVVQDETGARSEARIDEVRVSLGVDDLIRLGMIDRPDEGSGPSPSPTGGPEDDSEETGTDRTEGAGERERQQADEPTPNIPFEEPSTSPSASPSEEDVVMFGEGESENLSSDGNAVEFTLEDVRASAEADFEGRTAASLEYGEITAFGAALPEFEDDHLAQETLEVIDTDGATVDEVPVGVRFIEHESTFEDDQEDWEGEGVRSALTVWVQIGDPEDENGFAVDFADVWAIGSTHAVDAREGGGNEERGETSADEAAAPSPRLATTGSSIAALITAAVVAVGGGASATFLARKRTTAMDDRIED
ncbi:hypothetical protein [Nocardiopsis sp. MG754419]|uniref:hypothetical protein n=1 Tax=Nocardiopsis sp. MG754419 TaxID=2259865 RepID=UPI0027DCDE76|nr:hypothetical protein [Nocardiopsis sp. MG754419]